MVVVSTGDSSIHAHSICKLGAGFWQLLHQAPEVDLVKKSRREHEHKVSIVIFCATARQPSILMRKTFVVQPQARPLVSGRVEIRLFHASRIYHDITTTHR